MSAPFNEYEVPLIDSDSIIGKKRRRCIDAISDLIHVSADNEKKLNEYDSKYTSAMEQLDHKDQQLSQANAIIFLNGLEIDELTDAIKKKDEQIESLKKRKSVTVVKETKPVVVVKKTK